MFYVAGPSGTGKTLTAKQLAYAWIGEPNADLDPVVFIDCGSLSLKHERAVLTGSPPGYVGYEDAVGLEQVGQYEKEKHLSKREIINQWIQKTSLRIKTGQIPALVWRRLLPFLVEIDEKAEKEEKKETKLKRPCRCVVIFDEFEKAHLNIQRQLLSILEEGKLRLQSGRVVDFTGSLIIFTTNVGTQQISDEYLSGQRIGYKTPAREKIQKSNGMDKAIWTRVRREIESGKYFLPELLGRIGKPGIIVFQTLKHADYLKILEVELSEVQKRLSENYQFSPGNLSISYTKEFKDFLIQEGVDPRYGARALSNVVKKYMIEPIANAILNGELKQNDKILFEVKYREVSDDDGEEREEGETEIRRQPREESREYPPFVKKKWPAADRKKIEKMLDEKLNEILKNLSGTPKNNPRNNSPESFQ